MWDKGKDVTKFSISYEHTGLFPNNSHSWTQTLAKEGLQQPSQLFPKGSETSTAAGNRPDLHFCP